MILEGWLWGCLIKPLCDLFYAKSAAIKRLQGDGFYKVVQVDENGVVGGVDIWSSIQSYKGTNCWTNGFMSPKLIHDIKIIF